MNKQQATNYSNNIFIHIPTGKTVRRNGATKTWKRDENRFCMPIKHGLYAYGYITNENAGEFELKYPEIKQIKCEGFSALTNGGDFRGKVCCGCGESEEKH